MLRSGFKLDMALEKNFDKSAFLKEHADFFVELDALRNQLEQLKLDESAYSTRSIKALITALKKLQTAIASNQFEFKQLSSLLEEFRGLNSYEKPIKELIEPRFNLFKDILYQSIAKSDAQTKWDAIQLQFWEISYQELFSRFSPYEILSKLSEKELQSFFGYCTEKWTVRAEQLNSGEKKEDIAKNKLIYLHQLIPPTDLVMLLKDKWEHRLDIINLKKLLETYHINLHGIAKHNRDAAKIILSSVALCAALPPEQYKELRTSFHEFKSDVNDVSQTSDLASLSVDLDETLQLLKDNLDAQSYIIQHAATLELKKPLSESTKNTLLSYSEQYAKLSAFISELAAKLRTARNISELSAIFLKINQELHDKLNLSKITKLADEVNQLFSKHFSKYPALMLEDTWFIQPLKTLDTLANYINAKYYEKHELKQNYENIRTSFLTLHQIFTTPSEIATESKIPKIVHYHWYGKPMPADYIKNILTTHKYAPDHQILLFTDNPKNIFAKGFAEIDYFPHFEELVKRGTIKIVTVDELLNDAKSIFSPRAFAEIKKIIIHEKSGLLNYAALADLARLISLLSRGGIYMDTDIVATKKMEFDRPQRNLGFFASPRRCWDTPWNNDFMMSTPQHPILRSAITKLLNNYIEFYRTPAIVTAQRRLRTPQSNDRPANTMQVRDQLAIKSGLNTLALKREDMIDTLKDGSGSLFSRMYMTLLHGGPGVLAAAIDDFDKEYNIVSGSGRSIALTAGKHTVPAKVSRKHAGEYTEKVSEFGGIFLFNDNSWMDSKKETKSSPTKKPKPPKRGFTS